MSQGFEILLNVLGGLGIFLFGMEHMSGGMQKIAGERIKKIIAAVTTNRFMAIVVGVLVTALVQSSSVSTVMTIGLVNAGLMTLKQALGVILGANIGTTITGWILVLKIGKYGLPIAGIAAICYVFLKSDRAKTKALTLMGLGLIFFGLELMKDGFAPMKEMPFFVKAFHMFNAESGFFGVLAAALVGCLLTAIVQSSSATLGITITLAVQGLINPVTAVALVLGENVGTTITAMLASLRGTPNARRAAYAHTIMNIIGVFWVTAAFTIFIKLLGNFANPETNVTKYIATAHTMFNVTNVLIFIPLLGLLTKLLYKILPESEDQKANEEVRYTHLDDSMLVTPILAIDQSKKEIIIAGEIVKNSLEDLNEALVKGYDGEHDKVQYIFDAETILDHMQDEIATINTKILTKDIEIRNTRRVRRNIAICDQLESLSDYAERAIKVYLRLKENGNELNEYKKNDLNELHKKVMNFYLKVADAYKNGDKAMLEEGKEYTEGITEYYRVARAKHLDRMEKNPTNAYLSTGYMDILTHYRRITDHTYSILEIMNNNNGLED